MERHRIISHEIGHGIISYLFSGEYYTFEGIQLDPKNKFNKNDSAYTISKPLDDLVPRINNDNHLAAAIDGLVMLSGIAGLTVFESTNLDKFEDDATLDNYKTYFDFEGSSGDFEIIERKGRPYGWYLFEAARLIETGADIRHFRLLNFLKNLFKEDVILEISKNLKEKLDTNGELTSNDFEKVFEKNFVAEKIEEIKSYLKTGIGKPILVE